MVTWVGIDEEASKKSNPYRFIRHCPFGVRDLENDVCYSGNGINKCKYFKKYDWEKHYGHVECHCDLPRIDIEVKKEPIQLELFA